MVLGIYWVSTWYLVCLGLLESINANTQVRHTLPSIAERLRPRLPRINNGGYAPSERKFRRQQIPNFSGINEARSFTSSPSSFTDVHFVSSSAPSNNHDTVLTANEVLRQLTGNDGGKQLYGSSEARSFSSSINSQQSIINGGGQQPVSSRHQQGGEVFQARALAANKEPFIQQVQQISNPNKYEDDLLRTDLVKSFQYPNKHNSYGDKDNLETSIQYRDDNIKVRIEAGGSNTDNVIIKDIYSVDVNDNSEHNVIDEIESVKYVDDYLQSAVNSQVIDRFDKQVIEDELLKEYSDLSVKNVVGRQYIPLDTHKEYIPVETHNIVYMDSNSSTFSSSLNDDSTALDSTPTRTYIVHDPAFNKGQSQSPILDVNIRGLNDGKGRQSSGTPVHHITSNTRTPQSGDPVHYISTNTRITQSGDPVHYISGNTRIPQHGDPVHHITSNTRTSSAGPHKIYTSENPSIPYGGQTSFGGNTLTTKLVPPPSQKPVQIISTSSITTNVNPPVRTIPGGLSIPEGSQQPGTIIYTQSNHNPDSRVPIRNKIIRHTVPKQSHPIPPPSESLPHPTNIPPTGSDIRTVQHVRQSIPRVDVGPPPVLAPNNNGAPVLAGNNRQNAAYPVERYQTTSNLVDTQNIVNKDVRIKILGDTSDILPSTAQLLQSGEWHSASEEKKKNSFIPQDVVASGGVILKVLNLNLWGLGWPLGEDKDPRVLALREELLDGKYDIVMLQELWYRADYELLKSTMPYVTEYDSINSGCTSFILPLGCSGLTVLSRHPILDVRLIPFNERGSFWRFDGEIFVRKGLGVARILFNQMTIDVFTTHLVSYTNIKADDNKLVRYMQATETTNAITKSDADIQIFGGDINANPIDSLNQPYGMLSSIMKDALLEKYKGQSFHPYFATFGNSENTYTRHYKPERIDYLMYRTNNPAVKMETRNFSMPIMLTRATDGRIISVSDHEPLVAEFIIHDTRNITQPRTFA